MAKDPKSSEPFVSQQDRPAVGADTPVSELKVRDLHAILASAAHNAAQFKFQKDKDLEKVHKDFDKTHPDKPHKEIFEAALKHLPEKLHVDKFQPEKIHPEKIHPDKVHKDLEKPIVELTKGKVDAFKNTPELPPDPTQIGGDPATQISQLQATVDQLSSEVAEMKAKITK